MERNCFPTSLHTENIEMIVKTKLTRKDNNKSQYLQYVLKG